MYWMSNCEKKAEKLLIVNCALNAPTAGYNKIMCSIKQA